MVRLVLWDIDHTLIATRGVGLEIFAAAFKAVTGRVMERQARVDGSTDPVIFSETAQLHGIAAGRSDIGRFAAELAAGHRRRAADIRARGHALPGAAAAMDALAAAGIEQTVVTGNIRATAHIKLAAFGLDGPVRWEIGAYGEDSDDRPGLVAAALRRAAAAPAEALLIGDTPADVRGAEACGVPVLAVASGRSTAAELRAAGADTVLADLTDTDAVLRLAAPYFGERRSR